MKILVVADTQCRGDVSLEYMSWLGRYLVHKRPDTIVHIGDHHDFPSLSEYDRGKLSFEGRRLKEDLAAGEEGMNRLLGPLRKLQAKQKQDKKRVYNPELHFCLGNHEDRFDRIAKDRPEFEGFLGTENLGLEKAGWTVHPFLKPACIEGIQFVHFLANPFTGKPYGGSALNQLKNVGNSFVVGHKQCLDVAIRPILDGSMQIGIINGACYPHDEAYKGHQGNNHFRGATMLHEVSEGFGCPMFVSLDYLGDKYG